MPRTNARAKAATSLASDAGVAAFRACKRRGSTGTLRVPCRAGEASPARRSSSSISTTSRSATVLPAPVSQAAASDPAAVGVSAKTAEYIFTLAGMPKTGMVLPTASSTSRAVPSPPAKRIKSTPASTRSRASPRVSFALLVSLMPVPHNPASNTVVGQIPCAASSPNIPGPVNRWTLRPDRSSNLVNCSTALRARPGDVIA